MSVRHLVLRGDLDGVAPDDHVSLTGSEARHAATVLRVRVGDAASVGDGAGTVADGHVTAVRPGDVVVRVEHVTRHPAPTQRVTLVQALARGDRDELAVQAATELGVDRVVPWSAERSTVRWKGEKRARGVERWETVTREASKQCLRAYVPQVEGCADSQDLPARLVSTRMFVLDPEAEVPLHTVVLDARDVAVIVGPEGGIALSEHDLFVAAGAERVRLGPEVLRTSTAGPVAIAILALRLGRW